VNEAVEKFRRLAEEYCAVVERPARDRLELQEALMELLPRLYLAASSLPLTEPETEDLLPDRPTNDERFAVMAGLQEVLGPSDLDHVADDLADIWNDLKQGLVALESGSAEADVIFSWRHDFTSHWGRHAVNALAAVHDFYW
jgi:hypothetical protein